MNSLFDPILEEILSQPTAPFREGRVISKITEILERHKIPSFQDPVGNILVGVSSKKEYLAKIRAKSQEPVRLYIAHMDHPGFHGVKWKSDTELLVKWHGGTPTQHLNHAPVWLADSSEQFEGAIVQEAQLLASGRAIDEATIRCQPIRKKPETLFGGFRFRAPFWREGELIYTHVADDLIGAYSIVKTAIQLWKTKKKSKDIPFIGLLTRAEEVGFIGAIAHFELGWIKQAKRKILCISLETSRALPGAEIGKGPVVRLGDRYTVFDAGALRVFTDLAQKLLPERHQRRVMDGGTCEATAATAYQLPAVGISVPLGNYHNQSLEGGPDAAPPNGPAPEFVHSQDIQGLLELCLGLLTPHLPWNKPWELKQKELEKSLKNYRTLLKSAP